MPLKSNQDAASCAPPFLEEAEEYYKKYRDVFESEEAYREARDIWPRCPQCGRRRITRCPSCKSSESLFPLADEEFYDRDAAEAPIDESRSTCAACSQPEIMPGVPDLRKSRPRVESSDVFDALPDERVERRQTWLSNETSRAPLVECPVCSEIFEPIFQRRCEWCGFLFEDGEDYDEESRESVEAFIARQSEPTCAPSDETTQESDADAGEDEGEDEGAENNGGDFLVAFVVLIVAIVASVAVFKRTGSILLATGVMILSFLYLMKK